MNQNCRQVSVTLFPMYEQADREWYFGCRPKVRDLLPES